MKTIEDLHSRTTVIIGAGAVLDFDFNGIIKPTTDNITKKVVEQKIQCLDEEESDIIKQIYERIVDASRVEFLRLHPDMRYFEPKVTFEDLFEVIESLYSYSGTWNHEHYPFPLISTLVHSELQYVSVDYYRAMVTIIEKIVEIVTAYDDRFREEGKELWFKDFWKEFEGKVDVFTLNYDTTIESSLENYIDGYVGFTQDYERFEPEVLWNADLNSATVNHLHGCILYGDTNPKPTEFHYSHRDLYKFYPDVVKRAFISNQWLPLSQTKNAVFYSPIITGLKKTDKICYMPHNFYHANLAKKIIENPSLLVCGYSFGDLYVNQLLQRHKLIHGRNERVIIVDKWPEYVNRDNTSMYGYFMENASSGFRDFFSRIIEGGNAPLESFNHFRQVSEGFWESPNGVLLLYTKGLKSAVEHQSDIIFGFLKDR